MPPGSSDFTPAEADTRFSDPGRTQGWVDLSGGYIPLRSPITELTGQCHGLMAVNLTRYASLAFYNQAIETRNKWCIKSNENCKRIHRACCTYSVTSAADSINSRRVYESTNKVQHTSKCWRPPMTVGTSNLPIPRPPYMIAYENIHLWLSKDIERKVAR